MKTWGYFAVAGLVFVGGLFIGRSTIKVPEPSIRYDTTRIVEFIPVDIPIPVDNYIVKNVVSLLYIHGDTTGAQATVDVPIEQKTYETPDYRATIQGYMPELIDMRILRETQYITETRTDIQYIKTKPRWSIGIQLGYGYGFNKKASPYIGIGLQYNLITFK